MKLLGCARVPRLIGEEELPGKANYFIGNDPRRWRTHIPTYASVLYRDIYPNIDLVFHGHEGQFEFDFRLMPGFRLDQVAIAFRGAERVATDHAGNLEIRLHNQRVLFRRPRAFQKIAGRDIEVPVRFELKRTGAVGFEVGRYDRSRVLVIDPVLTYSTYLGGSGTDEATAIAVDGAGNVYVTGTTTSSDFPTTTGAYQKALTGSSIIFISKLDPTGGKLLYSTYLGGSGNDISSHIAVDSSGNAYLTGLTSSADFPTTTGAFQTSLKGTNNAFITKLNAAGDGLVYSSYLGGSRSDFGNSLAIDASGNAYVVGVTSSVDFPTTTGAFQTAYGGGAANAFVTVLNGSGGGLVYSTFLGGSAEDEGTGIAVDSTGAAYIAGFSSSSNFPVTAGSLQTSLKGTSNAFVTKLNSAGSALVYSTYLGGSGSDQAADIAVDASGDAYVTGQTNSADFPLSNAYQGALGGGTDGFVAEVNPAGSSLVYSTYLGGNEKDLPQAIVLDSSGDAFLTGQTSSSDFPTDSAIQGDLLGAANGFVTELNPSGSALNFSTYLGGSANDGGTGIAVDSAGNVYVSGFTDSSDFPTLSGALQPSSAGGTDAFVVKIGPASGAAASLSKTSLVFGNQSLTTTSNPQTVVLRDVGSASLSISSITVGGDFAQTNNCFSLVPGGSSCELSITFSPTARGSRTGTLTIADNAANSPQTISLSGNGILTGLNLSTQSLTFTNQDIGTTSAPQTVTLTNTGQDMLTISGVIVTGDFGESDNCGSSIAAGASCAISVTFSPTQALTRTGTLEIVDNAPGSPQTVQLTGTGVGPAVVLSPAILTFSEQPVGTTSGPETLSLTNSGNAPLVIGSITISGPFAQSNSCGGTLAAGANCSISVNFSPSLAGTSLGAITISDNAPKSPQGVVLSGIAIAGQAPEVFLSSQSLSFGLQPVTTPSVSQPVTLTNTGNAALSITSIAVTGDYSQTNDCGSSVAAGAECAISVVFTPKTAGNENGAVTITDNASGSPHSVALTGGGDDFGFTSSTAVQTVNAGQTATYTVNVQPIFGFNQQVTITCAGAPQAATCTIQPAMVTLDGVDAAPLTVVVTTTARSMVAPVNEDHGGIFPSPIPTRGAAPLLGFLLLSLFMAGISRRLKRRRAWLLLALLLPVLLWSGCNVGGKINGTPPGSFTLTITGTTTANGATLSHSANLGLTVN